MKKYETVENPAVVREDAYRYKKGRIKGILYMLIAVLGLHFTRLFVKLGYFHSDISVWEMMTLRALTVVILCSVTILIKDKSLFYVPPHLRCLLFLRCFVGTISFSLIFISLKYLTYSTSMILYFLYPIFTSLIAWLLIKERLSIWDILALLLSLIGVVLFAFPQIMGQRGNKNETKFQENTPEGVVMGFLQAIFMALTIIVIRKIGKGLHALTTPIYFQIFALSIYSVILLVIGLTEGIQTHYTLEVILCIIGSGFFGYIGLVTMAIALQNEKAGRIATLQYVQIVFGFIFDIFLFKAQIGASQILGSALITVSSLLITILRCTNRIK